MIYICVCIYICLHSVDFLAVMYAYGWYGYMAFLSYSCSFSPGLVFAGHELFSSFAKTGSKRIKGRCYQWRDPCSLCVTLSELLEILQAMCNFKILMEERFVC